MNNRVRIGTTNTGDIYLRPDGKFELDAMAGSHIAKVCVAAASWASDNRLNLITNFNGIEINASLGSTAQELQDTWQEESDRRQKAYEASPAFAERKRREAEEVVWCQSEVDAIVAEMPNVLDDTVALLSLLCRLASAADLNGVKFDMKATAKMLETRWVRGDCVGMDAESIKASPELMAKWIVGQAIDCLHRYMPPHPTIKKFSDEYLVALRNHK